ncbi:MAG TPA: DUF362 domain-containing protein [Terracidiphilus sp.]|nr:DUF362 domain-containing protein [Terracidiphilus sp.]
MRKRRIANRREFLANCLVGAVSFASGAAVPRADAQARESMPPSSKVVHAQDSLLRASAASVDSGRIGSLLDRALETLYGSADLIHCWQRIVSPGQRVGLKVNTLGGRGLSTNVPLVEVICERLQLAGVRAQDIVVFDRDTVELERAGFRTRMGGNQVQCYGTDRAGFEDDLSEFGEVGSLVSKILTRQCDVLINVPVLKDHDGAGVSIALKNMYGVIHNPNKYHPNGCDPFVADVNMLPEIRSKLRLHICDATTACYEGGPAFKPQFAWQENALLVSEDPVALDHTGWQIIERKRAEQGLKTLDAEGRPPRYIATAADAAHRLGSNDPHRILLAQTRVA